MTGNTWVLGTKTQQNEFGDKNQNSRRMTDISSKTTLSVHTFSETVMGSTVFYQVIKMKDSLHVWIGTKPSLGTMALAMNTKFDKAPLATQLIGDSSNTFSLSLSQKLAKKTGKQVFISCSLTSDQFAVPLVEKRIIEEMKDKPDMF